MCKRRGRDVVFVEGVKDGIFTFNLVCGTREKLTCWFLAEDPFLGSVVSREVTNKLGAQEKSKVEMTR